MSTFKIINDLVTRVEVHKKYRNLISESDSSPYMVTLVYFEESGSILFVGLEPGFCEGKTNLILYFEDDQGNVVEDIWVFRGKEPKSFENDTDAKKEFNKMRDATNLMIDTGE